MFENLMKMLFEQNIVVYQGNPFTSLTPRQPGYQMMSGRRNGRAFMGNLRRVKKAQRHRAHLRSLKG